jgi:CubicO group peptidase (beta-lactamase class C family)
MAFLEIFLLLTAPISVIGACYTPEPSLPSVDKILNQTHFKQLAATLDSSIPIVLTDPEGWTTNTTSFALQVTSKNEKIWDYYYTAPILGEYKDSDPAPVIGDTAFRIASISKSFTVYALLLENKINLDDAITKYIPELLEQQPAHKGNWYPQWDEITIRSLASQLSGIARESKLTMPCFRANIY